MKWLQASDQVFKYSNEVINGFFALRKALLEIRANLQGLNPFYMGKKY
jgi:hypothetical protein